MDSNLDRVSEEQPIELEKTDKKKRYTRTSNQNRHKKCQTLANRAMRQIGLKRLLPFLKKREGKYYYYLTVFMLAKHCGKITDFKNTYSNLVENYKKDIEHRTKIE